MDGIFAFIQAREINDSDSVTMAFEDSHLTQEDNRGDHLYSASGRHFNMIGRTFDALI